MWQVYKITHKKSGKAYIGVTSTSIKQRVRAHMSRGTLIGMALVIYGEDAFSQQVLSVHNTKEEGLSAESEAIWEHKTHDPDGFNKRAAGGRYPGSGPQHFGNKFSRRTPCVAYHPDGTEAFRFETTLGASQATGISRNTIHRCFRQPHLKAGGYFWKRDDA